MPANEAARAFLNAESVYTRKGVFGTLQVAIRKDGKMYCLRYSDTEAHYPDWLCRLRSDFTIAQAARNIRDSV